MKLPLNNKGAALAMVIIVMVVLMILGTSALAMGLSETKFSVANEKKTQAEYIAKAGADIAADLFIRDNNFSGTNIFTSPLAWGNGVISSVTANKVDNAGFINDYVNITSTGTVDSSSRTVSLRLSKKTEAEVFDGIRLIGAQSEFNLKALDISHDANKVVNITANVPDASNILLSTGDAADPGIVKNVSDIAYPPVVIPPAGTYSSPDTITGTAVLDKPYYDLKTLKNGNNELITFKVAAGSEMTVIVDDLEFKGNATVTGGGKVRIYIRNTCQIWTPISVNTSSTGYLFFYIAKDKKLEFQANGTLTAYIYAPEATIQLNSDATTLVGSMVGKLILKNPSGEGPHGQFYYAPLPEGDTVTPLDYGYTKRYYYK
ncbi:pilus assembly PilX N-terminal domain-containing protein [Parasporobacterium paucivorans]|uniref:DUF7305 domain-containing protein n=1 Tax=Parasporobacterium paucivorans DSM 15970 TaxID=1122934 RepID=A0A1M6IR00_9FIRM|nr:pilus assembly PilX N-terminal domain-containing protein [Parasporobacterium paucivorans]SHJ36910.1 hypothetical protein SAMN02745691_01829 [Parasporobacterium paucivorans DSM 15970]